MSAPVSPVWSPLMTFLSPGWMEEDERLAGQLNHGTFTTGRLTRPGQTGGKKSSEFSPRSQESVASLLPGKLNLADYQHVTSALSRLNMKQRQAPLADDEELGEEGGGYAVPQDVINNGLPGSEYAQPILQEQHRAKPRSKNRERRERAKLDYSDSETDSSSDDRPTKKSGASRKTRKKRSAIPVATPVVPNIPIKLPETPSLATLEKRKLPGLVSSSSVLPFSPENF